MQQARVPIHVVDAFADRAFEGNPAAVCLLERPLDDALCQDIAAEMNLSETAFLVPEGEDFHLRWFTPATEVELCGHATLAAASVVLDRLTPEAPYVRFRTLSGVLEVTRCEGGFRMDFPALPPQPVADEELHAAVAAALGARPDSLWASEMLMAAFPHARDVQDLVPDMAALAALPRWSLAATAPSGDARWDFVSRFFAPAKGVPEDPVTGSAHCTLAPFWAQELDKDRVVGRQISRRGGTVTCTVVADRVHLEGATVAVLEGSLDLPRRP